MHRDLMREANRLPEKRLLTSDFTAMNLYINYGLDVFAIRDYVNGIMKSIVSVNRALKKKVKHAGRLSVQRIEKRG